MVAGSGIKLLCLAHTGEDVLAAKVANNQSLTVLTGGAATMADVPSWRRAEFGISYVSVNAMAMPVFAPVVELLAGR
jgi:hypothetical protein